MTSSPHTAGTASDGFRVTRTHLYEARTLEPDALPLCQVCGGRPHPIPAPRKAS